MIAIYLDPAMNKWMSQVRYSLEYTLNIGGFTYKFLEAETELKPNDIILYYSPEYPKDDWVNWMIEHHTFIYIPFVKEFFIPGSNSGDTLKHHIHLLSYSIDLPYISAKKPNGSPISISEQNKHKFCRYEFDVIGNIFFHLTDDERNHMKNKDKMNNYFLNELAFYNNFDIPYTNHYIDGFAKIISELMESKKQWQLKRCLWPNNQLFASIISINIDKLVKWSIGSTLKIFLEGFIHLIKFRYGLLFNNAISIFRIIFLNVEDYWNFDNLNQLLRKYKYKATWFFGTDLDKKKRRFDYEINDPELLKELADIHKNGSEIAFLNTTREKSKETLIAELDLLTTTSKTVRSGIRHTECFGDIERLDTVHKDFGLKYSSSRKLPNKNSFYNGLTLPYPIRISGGNVDNDYHYEIPITFADNHLMVKKYKSLNFNDAMKSVKEVIQKIKEVKGVFHFTITNSLFHDIRYMSRLTEYILDDLKNHNAYVNTCNGMIDWLQKRNKIEVKEDSNKILIKFLDNIEQITFEVIGPYRILNVFGGNVSFKKSIVQFVNVSYGMEVEIILADGEPFSE